MKLKLARTGDEVRLGEELGRGGEGIIFAVAGRSDRVVKIYHRPPEPRKVEKLRAMARAASEDLLSIAAWPVEIVLRDRAPHGFVMPAVRARRDVHELYSPKSRFDAFPTADFRFLLHVAGNVARAFATVHGHGHVIGDVNHGSVLVGPDGTVRLIDCDSFQISVAGDLYTCDVGVPLFTPPELHGRSFRGLVRSRDHDGFGLAVLLFHLFFMGRHPFAGRFRGKGDMPIERAIAERRFAYGPLSLSSDMERPPGTLSLDALGAEAAQLFVRAFTTTDRPEAAHWLVALDQMKTSLRACAVERSHHYPGHLSGCPWCGLEKATGVALFGQRIMARTATGAVDLAELWKAIERVPDPGEDPPLPATRPSTHSAPAVPSVKLLRQLAAIALVVIGFAACHALETTMASETAVFLWVLAAIAWPRANAAEVRAADHRAAAARKAYDQGVVRFRGTASRETWVRELNALREARVELIDLPKLRARRLARLHAEREKLQLVQYLDRFRIDRAKISGIGPGRTAMLTSYGIESAADLEYGRIVRIPGFGDALAERLLRWRDSHRRRFRFNPALPVDRREVAKLDRELEQRRRELVERLRNGPAMLDRLRRQVLAQRPRQLAVLEAAWREVQDAEAVRRAL